MNFFLRRFFSASFWLAKGTPNHLLESSARRADVRPAWPSHWLSQACARLPPELRSSSLSPPKHSSQVSSPLLPLKPFIPRAVSVI